MRDTSVPITLNGLVFNAGPVDGVEWTVADVQGLGGAGVRYQSDGRVQQDGSWSTRSYRTSQAMGLEGMCEFRSAADIPVLIDRLNSAVALEPVPLTAHWPGGDRTRMVKRDGAIEVVTAADRWFSWSATVVADDPRWYAGGPGGPIGPGLPVPPSAGVLSESTGLPASSGGLSVPFTVPFSIDAQVVSGDVSVSTTSGGWWLFKVEAHENSLQSPRLVVTGADGVSRTLAWDGLNLNAGEFLVVDPQKHTSLLQGQATRVPSTRQWPLLGAGSTLVQFRADNYVSAQASVYWVPFA